MNSAASAKLKTVTLGCKVNQYETEYVRQGLLEVGFSDAAESEEANLCIVNTCTVTNEGDAKSRKMIRRLARDFPDRPPLGSIACFGGPRPIRPQPHRATPPGKPPYGHCGLAPIAAGWWCFRIAYR